MLSRQIVIGFGLAIIFPLLISYGVRSFYPPPHISPLPALSSASTPEERDARQNLDQKRRSDFVAESTAFARVLLLVSAPAGLAAILIGALMSIRSAGTGLIAGGILTIAFGYWSYWDHLNDLVRFGSLLTGFVLLLLIALRQFGTRTAAG